MKENSQLKISQHFQFEASAVQSVLQRWQLSPLEAYEARLALLKVAIGADYDELVCLPDLTEIDKHWYQLETAKKVIKQFGGKATPAWTPYCRFNVAYTAEADEKRLGLASFWLNGVTGVAGVDVGDALLWASARTPIPEEVELDAALVWPIAQQVGREAIEREITPWRNSLERKLNRDERRLRDYYQTIIEEIQRKCQKKKLEGEALTKELSRIEATELELKRKLADLEQRYTLSVTARIHSVLVAWLQTVHNFLEPQKIKEAGLHYIGIGRLRPKIMGYKHCRK